VYQIAEPLVLLERVTVKGTEKKPCKTENLTGPGFPNKGENHPDEIVKTRRMKAALEKTIFIGKLTERTLGDGLFITVDML